MIISWKTRKKRNRLKFCGLKIAAARELAAALLLEGGRHSPFDCLRSGGASKACFLGLILWSSAPHLARE